MPLVFVSYRTQQSGQAAGRIAQRLRERLGSNVVFKDTESIRKGDDIKATIDDALDRMEVMVVVVGRDWVCAELNSEDDYVRREVAHALRRGIPTVPLFVDGADPTVIDRGRLPFGLKDLWGKNGHAIRHGAREFDADLELIVQDLAARFSIRIQSAMPAASGEPAGRRMRGGNEQGYVDFGIITIREDEFRAMLRRLPVTGPTGASYAGSPIRQVATMNDDVLSVAVVRCGEHGNGEAQAVARNLIEDLDPQWLLVVGIAGAVPASEFSLGDVVVSSQVIDFSVEAVQHGAPRAFAPAGFPLHRDARDIVANLIAREPDLGPWNSVESIGLPRPPVELDACLFHGDPEWCERVRRGLEANFVHAPRASPRFTSGVIASSDRLVEDTDLVRSLLASARQFMAVEMESAGVFRAAWARGIPVVAIRGISDIVGLERDDAWTAYACESAAAFAAGFMQLGVVTSRSRQGASVAPPEPDPHIAPQVKLLATTRARKARLKEIHESTDDVDREILALRREIREGGRLRRGDDLIGRYVLREPIGRGGFAVVWKAFDRVLGREVAVKVLHANLAGDPVRLERFQRGARIMAELDHPSVVPVLRTEGEDLGFHFFVMEYLPAGNLQQAVVAGRLNRGQILSVMFGVGDALASAHQRKFVHRDVKPENILLDGEMFGRLSDFDLVGAADTTGGTRTGFLGTHLFAAPEQMERPQDVDARADVFSLGMTLVFAIHGAILPTRVGRNPERFIDGLACSAELKALLKQAVAEEAADRHADVSELCRSLSAVDEVAACVQRDLCTGASWRLMAPIFSFFARVEAPPPTAAWRHLHHFYSGRLAEERRDLAEAEACLRAAHELRPDHGTTADAYAEVLQKAGRWSRYVELLGARSTTADDQSQQVDLLLAAAAVCEDQLGDPALAQDYYQRVLAIDASHQAASARLEAICRARSKWPDLVEVLLARARRHVEVRDQVALLREVAKIYEDRLDDLDGACMVLEDALLRDRGDEDTLRELDRMATAPGRYVQIADCYARAARRSSDRQDDAAVVDLWQRVLALRGDDTEALSALAEVHERGQRWDELASVLEHRGELGIEQKPALFKRLGRLRSEKLGDHEAALAAWLRADVLSGQDDLEILDALTTLFRSKESWEVLAHTLRRMIVVHEQRPGGDLGRTLELYAEVGRIEGDVLEHVDEAVDAWRSVLTIDPDDVRAHAALEALFVGQGRWDDAIELLEKRAHRLEEADGKVAVLLRAASVWEAKLAKPDTAAGVYERVRELDSGNPTASDRLEAIYRHAGRWRELVDVLLERASGKTEGSDQVQLLAEIAGIYESELGDLDAAYLVLEEAFKGNPADERVARDLERLTSATDRWKELLEDYPDRARELESTRPAQAADLWVTIGGWYGDHLGHLEYARHCVEQALRLDPRHLGALQRLAELQRGRGAWWELVDTLSRHAAAEPSPVRQAELQVARGQLLEEQLSKLPQAMRAYRSALALQPTSIPALSALERLYRARKRWAALIDVLGIRAGLAQDEAEAVRLGLEIGAIADEHGHDPSRAIAAYERVLAIAPGNLVAQRALERLYEMTGRTAALKRLHGDRDDGLAATQTPDRLHDADQDPSLSQELLDLYTESKQWRKAIETIDRLVGLEPDPVRKGAHFMTAGTIARDELKAGDRAIQYYKRALDSFFAGPSELDETSWPLALQAFRDLDDLLTLKMDWRAKESALRIVLARVPDDAPWHDSVFRDLRVQLLDALGEIYRSRLGHFRSAIIAFERAHGLDGGNKDRLQILGELYVRVGGAYADKAIALLYQLARDEPLRYDAYRSLYRVYRDTQQLDRAWCMSAALAFLQKADAEQRQFHELHKPPGLVHTKTVMSPESQAKLVHSREDRRVSKVLAGMWSGVAAFKAYPHEDLGITREDRREPATDQLPFSRIFHHVADVLGVMVPEVFLVEDGKPAEMQLANFIDETELCPAFVVRPSLLEGKTERELAFLSARRLSFMRPEYYLSMLLPTSTELKAAIVSTIAVLLPEYPIPSEIAPLVGVYMPEIRSRLHLMDPDRLGAAVDRFVRAAGPIDLVRWGHAVDAASHRAGFVACGDLEVAARMIQAEPAAAGAPSAKDKITGLILFAISEEYFAIRQQLGIVIG